MTHLIVPVRCSPFAWWRWSPASRTCCRVASRGPTRFRASGRGSCRACSTPTSTTRLCGCPPTTPLPWPRCPGLTRGNDAAWMACACACVRVCGCQVLVMSSVVPMLHHPLAAAGGRGGSLLRHLIGRSRGGRRAAGVAAGDGREAHRHGAAVLRGALPLHGALQHRARGVWVVWVCGIVT